MFNFFYKSHLKKKEWNLLTNFGQFIDFKTGRKSLVKSNLIRCATAYIKITKYSCFTSLHLLTYFQTDITSLILISLHVQVKLQSWINHLRSRKQKSGWWVILLQESLSASLTETISFLAGDRAVFYNVIKPSSNSHLNSNLHALTMWVSIDFLYRNIINFEGL